VEGDPDDSWELPDPEPATARPKPTLPPPTPAKPASKPAPMPTEEIDLLDVEVDDLVLDPDTRAVVATCEAELDTVPDPLRAARLHCEIGLAYQAAGQLDAAIEHFKKALVGAPDHVVAIRGARCTYLARGDHDAALPLYDAEERLTPHPKRKARLLLQKGRLLEDRLGDPRRARDAYVKALELDPSNASILRALEHGDRRDGNVEMLLQTLERAANAATDDSAYRAALLLERAQLVERRGDGPGPSAGELYESALHLDPRITGASAALERIYRRDQQWRDLAGALERASLQIDDPAGRALVLYQLARVRGERLGDRAEAVTALVGAATATPGDPLVLEDLARGHEVVGDFESLAGVLAELVEIAPDRRERVALHHRLGQVFEGPLGDPAAAIVRYRLALDLDPTYLPVLQALGRLLAAREQWTDLIAMHLAEAVGARVAARAAASHARVAEIFEVHVRDLEKAAEHHARALTLVPGYPASFKALGRLYSQLDRHREHVELLERAVAEVAQPSLKVAYLFKIGSIWEELLGDPAQAMHAFRRMLDVDPARAGGGSGDLVAIHAIQRVAERAGRYQQLVEALEKEIALVDDAGLRVGLLHRVGTVFDDHLRDQDAALSRFRRALEIDPAFVPALASVGRIYYRAGRWSDLLDVYVREVEATPDQQDAVGLLHKMGELCEDKLGDVDAAIAWYQRAVDIDPTYRPAIRALVRRLRERGNWSALARALELEVAGLEHAPSRAVTWFRIGQVHEEWLGDGETAIAAYREALANVPDYRPAEDALARLHEERGEWGALIDVLGRRATSSDPIVAASATMRQGQIARDELSDTGMAIACFEAVVEKGVGVVTALLALEPLYVAAAAHQKLVGLYTALGGALVDSGARIAAFREVARIHELHDGALRERAAAYEAILAIDASDDAALSALEQIGRSTRDDRILARVYGRLAETADSAPLAAAYFTGLGRALERIGDKRAVVVYEAAVQRDAGSLAAIRGLGRAGAAAGKTEAVATAARLEAELTRRPEAQAALYVRAGTVDDLERALDAWPDHGDAARQIAVLLGETDVPRLVDILTKTASCAKSSERKTALWLDIGALYADRQNNLGAAITAFKRALDATPGHDPTLTKLAAAYRKNQQWSDAVAILEQQLASLTAEVGTDEVGGARSSRLADDGAIADARLELAAIALHHLDDAERATRCVEDVLRRDPDHEAALQRMIEIQLRVGNQDAAAKTAQHVAGVARSPGGKAAALVQAATIHRSRGDDAAADTALCEALGLEGPGGPADTALTAAIERDARGNWVGYAAALDTFVKRAATSKDKPANFGAAYLALARAYGDGMKLPNRAIDTLVDGIEAVGTAEPTLVIALARRLRDAGRHDEALDRLKLAAAVEPTRVELWRELMSTFDHAKRADDAKRARAALAVIGDAADRATIASDPAGAAERSFDEQVMAHVAVDGVDQSATTSLIATLVEPIARLYPPSLERYGLANRDRIGPRSGKALWDVKQRVAAIFGTELELFEHDNRDPVMVIEPYDDPALIVSRAIGQLPHPQQVFVVACATARIAMRLHAALALDARELDAVVVGAGRVFVPDFILGGSSRAPAADAVETAREAARKHVGRRWRKQHELAAGELAAQPVIDLVKWRWAAEQTTLRAAMLVADDLAATVAALKCVTVLPAGASGGRALVEQSDVVRDLLRFWISNRAAAVRIQTGIVAR
jgi:tetratricopeptide (TPR) repeat protein